MPFFLNLPSVYGCLLSTSPLFYQFHFIKIHPNDLISTWSSAKTLFPNNAIFTGN